ncbi:amidohydrolase [Bifidobacterium thermophilum]|uniref:M20 metallopeptidase family protein n=1 Tax=Bifidobacterium thermophilum TaxID=33905 RepID=UPI0030A00087
MAEHIELTDGLVATRRHLHETPELSFKEVNTSAFLADKLHSLGVQVLDSPLETGVIGLIEGEHDGPRVGLRADIDGLPVTEESGLDFASHNPGVMHACGHDIHMTSLLGAVEWFASHRDRIDGSLKIVFQPAEETGRGAKSVVDSGMVDDLDAMVGTHNNPDYTPGQLAVGIEPMMAGCVKFYVDLHAEGTHAGYPHLGTGPLEAMASMILSLQTIVSRNATPFHPLVVSVTEVHGGDVWNVVPAEAGFLGTVRYFYKEDSQLAERRMRAIVEHTAAAYGISADFRWDDFQDPLVSDPDLAKAVAADVPDYADLEPIHPSMAGEDFVEFGKVCPLVFTFVGSNGGPGHHGLHSPKFIAKDEAVKTGTEFYINAALRVLGEVGR